MFLGLRILSLGFVFFIANCALLTKHHEWDIPWRNPANDQRNTIAALSPSVAQSCMNDICGDRQHVKTEDRLLRKLKLNSKYSSSSFFKQMDKGFSRLNGLEQLKKRRREELIRKFTVERLTTDFKKTSIFKYWAVINFLNVYSGLINASYRQYRKENKSYSPLEPFLLNEDIIKNSPDLNDDNRSLMLKMLKSQYWSGIASSVYLLENAEFETFKGDLIPIDHDGIKVRWLQNECAKYNQGIADKYRWPLVFLKRRVMECYQDPDEVLSSRRSRDLLTDAYYSLKMMTLVLTADHDEAFGHFNVSDEFLDRLRKSNNKTALIKNCHPIVERQWNLTHWPEQNVTFIKDSISKIISQSETLLKLPNTADQKLFSQYLNSIVFKYPETPDVFEKRALSSMQNILNTESFKNYSRLSLSDQAFAVRLIGSEDELNSYCDELSEPLIPDAFIGDYYQGKETNTSTILIGNLAMNEPNVAPAILAHEMGHAISYYFRKVYAPVDEPEKLKVRSCLKELHNTQGISPYTSPYAEEDFADHFSGLILKDNAFEKVQSVTCGFDPYFEFRPRHRLIEPQSTNDAWDSHSIPLFRSINIHNVRYGSVPNSCGAVLKQLNTHPCF